MLASEMGWTRRPPRTFCWIRSATTTIFINAPAHEGTHGAIPAIHATCHSRTGLYVSARCHSGRTPRYNTADHTVARVMTVVDA